MSAVAASAKNASTANASARNALRVTAPTANASARYDLRIDRPISYTPHQRGGTCLSDTYEVILCYSDVIRHMFLDRFQEWLTVEKAKQLTETYEPYNEFIRAQYGNSTYAKIILIRYLYRQSLEVKPPVDSLPSKSMPSGLKRTPSVNGNRGTVARLAFNEDIVKIKANAFHHTMPGLPFGTFCPDSPSTIIRLVRQMLPGIEIFNRDVSLRADWKTTLVAVKVSVVLPKSVSHAVAFVRNHDRWYLCEDAFGHAFEIPERFVDHLLYSLVLGELVEYYTDRTAGYLSLIVNHVEILKVSRIFPDEMAKEGIGSFVMGSSAFVTHQNYKSEISRISGRDDINLFFVKSSAPVLTPSQLQSVKDRAGEIASELVRSEPESPSTNWRLLFYAIERGDEPSAIEYIKKGTDVRVLDGVERITPLMLACRMGLLLVARAIFESPTLKDFSIKDVCNAKNMYGDTAFILACETNYKQTLPILDLLLRKGADPNVKNKRGETALCIACKRMNVEVALFLINEVIGIDVNLGNPYSLIEGDDDSAKSLKAALVAKGADPTVKIGPTDLFNKKLTEAMLAEDYDAAMRIIAEGGEPTARNLHIASDNEPLMLALLEKPGAKINEVYNGTTPLHSAALMNQLAVVNKLLELKADINVLSGGKTPLFLACRWSREKVALRLIEAGADVSISNPIILFRGDRMPAVKAALIAKGAKDDILHSPESLRHNKTRMRKRRTNRKSRRNR